MVQTGVSNGRATAGVFEAAMSAAMALTPQLELAAAVVAHLRSATAEIHPSINAEVSAIAHHVVANLDELSSGERQVIAGMLTSIFRQAADLIECPERAPGWTFDDPVILQATGKASMSVAGMLAGTAPALGDLSERLASGGLFCDVGTGTGWLAIAAARHWPAAAIVGIDIFPRALELAERNIVDQGLSDRVRVRSLDVRNLDEPCDLIWLPGPFLPATVVPPALIAARRCVSAGGWLAFGVYGGPQDPVARSLARLRTIRSGGHPWTIDDAVVALDAAGFVGAHEVDRTWNAPIRLIVAQQP